MEQHYTLDELLVIKACIDYFILDFGENLSITLRNCCIIRLEALKDKVVEDIYKIDPEFEFPY